MLKFKGTWRIGVYFHAGDISVRGPWTYEAIADHVAGTQSEPGAGADWARYWKGSDGVVVARAVATSDPLPTAPAVPNVTVVPFPVMTSPPAPLVDQAPVPVQREVHSLPVPATAPSLPATVPAASEILDDSQEGALSVAFALDAIRQKLAHAVRRDDLAQALSAFAERLALLEAKAPEPALEHADPIVAEAWRRKCELLQVPTIAAARAQIDGMTRDMLRLLRKRDKGGAFTPLEASRVAILDVLDQHLADIDARAAELALETPPDITADRHWPTLGATI